MRLVQEPYERMSQGAVLCRWCIGRNHNPSGIKIEGWFAAEGGNVNIASRYSHSAYMAVYRILIRFRFCQFSAQEAPTIQEEF